MNAIWDYYNSYDEESRLEKDNYHKTEFVTTIRLLEPYLTGTKTILEVGAGTGRYSCWLAEQGHRVTAVDFTPKHVEIMRRKIAEKQLSNMRAELGDARDLSAYAAGSFDLVLCLGPLYHIQDEGGRRACLDECLRVLKPGGTVAAGYINRAGVYLNQLMRRPEVLLQHPPLVFFDADQPGSFPDGCFVHSSPAEMLHFMSPYDLLDVKHAAVDGLAPLIWDCVNQMDAEQFAGWVDYQYAVSCDPYQLGSSVHNLYIGTKH
ncbi:class I SAM-dependent methyltransferase [Gorillibacterium timonense]|uniref:class I SAM-dependent methyltransferase n=1 Tax=Gorillibacterium timonense TaxID=1689269 RepID=UPI00071C3D41|nr:class I SAM-dependent methyltransferase [Gorillibacterium timonense]